MSATTAAAAAAPPPPPHSKPTKILACVHCQYRKIKCDRQQPCSNCIKAKIACKPSTPAPPHKRRRPNQDLLERLARCEQLLKQYADGNVPVQGDSPLTATGPNAITSIGNSQPVSSPPMKVEDKRIPTGKVVKEDGNDRFMDNYIRISFVDELAAMRNIIDCGDDESESSTTGLSPGNDADLFLGLDDMTIDLQELQPDLVSVFRLWQIFLDRVNPLTKIIHVPSMQSIVMNAANDIKQVPLSEQALLFAIYSMAVVSLNMQEVVQILGMTREEAISRYTRGTKLALARANFMKNYNMSILQALALYMLAINTRSENNSNWIMGGTVMRIAQKMGYHRDGEQFNLSPFDTEMRRRIWWHIHVQDIRNAMLSGLSHSWVTTNWDTKMPLNINDAEMSPSSMEPLVPRDGPTEMAFVLIIYTYQKFNSKTHPAFEAAFMAFRAGVGSNHESEVRGPIETYRALIDEVDAELAEFERKYVDPTLGGVQEAASIIRPMFIDKMKDIMTPMHEQPEWGLEIFDQLDSLFKAFVQTHTRNVAIYKRMSNSGFLWFIRGGFQLDALLLFTIKLYKRPTGKLTDDAWGALESLHEIHPDLFDISQKKIDRQAQLTLKAWAVRERALAQRGQPAGNPAFIQRLRQLVSFSRAPSTVSSESPASMSQQFLLQQTTPFTQMPLDLGDVNQFLGNNMDTPNISLDMWGNITMENEADTQQQVLPYGGFDFSKLDFSTMDFMR